MQFSYALSQDLIFIPFTIMAIATLYVYAALSKKRVELFKAGIGDVKNYALNEGEPEESKKYNNALRNQFEAPVLFYAVCLASYVTQTASVFTITLAFAYAIFKILHIKLHITENNVLKRRAMFIKSIYVLIALWALFAIQLIIKQF